MPRAYARTDPSMRARVLARVALGETLAAVRRSAGMPTSRSVRNWARADAGFGAERLMRMVRAATPETAREVSREMRPIMGRHGRMRLRG